MKSRPLCSGLLLAGLMSSVAAAAVPNYSQNFEDMTVGDPPQSQPTDLADDGWLVGANVFDASGTTYLYNYFSFPAPNGGAAFSAVATGEGGAEQGSNQLSVYNDYNNADHGVGNRIEAIVFQERVLDASDAGKTFALSFDAKKGNIEGETTAAAFLQVLDPGAGFSQVALYQEDTTNLATTWSSFSGTITIPNDGSFNGNIFQFGFRSTASNYEGSGNYYDNINVVAIPEPGSALAIGLGGIAFFVRRRRR